MTEEANKNKEIRQENEAITNESTSHTAEHAVEEPYAVNNTAVTDEMNKTVLTRVMRGPLLVNTMMIAAGLVFIGIIFLISGLVGKSPWSNSYALELILCSVMVIFGSYGYLSVKKYIKKSVSGASQSAVRRKTYFYSDKLVVDIAFEETEVEIAKFVKMKETKTLLILFFKGENNRTEVFFVAKDGFENEAQRDAVVTFFSKKPKTAKEKK